MIDPLHVPIDLKDYALCLKDKMWRLHNLYWIKNKLGKRVKFRPNKSQLKFLKERHGRDIILKARQRGFTTLIQIDMLDDCIFLSDFNAGVIAHTRDDAQAFFKDKIKYAYDHLAAHIKEGLQAKNDAANELRFSNDSVTRVGVSLRSGTNQYLHVSEFGKVCARNPEKAKEIKTGAFPTVPNEGKLVIESTAEGRDGTFFEMCEEARKRQEQGLEPAPLEYKFHFFPWFEDEGYVTDPIDIYPEEYNKYFDKLALAGIVLSEGQKAWYYHKSKEQGDEMKREYPSTPKEAFEAAIEGAYFSRQMATIRAKGQITRVPIVPGVPIQTFWDLGRDTTAIWFFQKVGFDYRFVDYYENSGEWMAFYIDVLAKKRDGIDPYQYGDVWLPHDGKNKSIAAEKSPAQLLFEAGYQVRIVTRTPDKDIAIQQARYALPLCHFDSVKCEKGILHLDNYRKEWDEKLGTWKKTPLHNAASHGADAFMTWSDGFHHEEEVEREADSVQPHGRNTTTGY